MDCCWLVVSICIDPILSGLVIQQQLVSSTSNATRGPISQFSLLCAYEQSSSIKGHSRKTVSHVRVAKLWKWVFRNRRDRRRTITNQLVRRRNPTPHEFPAGWTIKSGRVCPTFLDNERRNVNQQSVRFADPFFQPLFNPFASTRRSISSFLFCRVHEPRFRFLDANRCEASSATRRERERERDDITRFLRSNSTLTNLWCLVRSVSS